MMEIIENLRSNFAASVDAPIPRLFASGCQGRRAALLVAVLAALISVMGFTGRTPLGRLPDVAWSWSNDSFLISMRLGSAFILPLALAIVGTATLLVRNKGRLYGT